MSAPLSRPFLAPLGAPTAPFFSLARAAAAAFAAAAARAAAFALAAAAALLATAAFGQSFTAITGVDPVLVSGGHRSAAWIDADGDGDLDLHVTRGGALGEPDDVYWNDGTGVFTRDTANALCQDGLRSVGATWGDFDGDGDEDPFSVSWYGEVNALYTNDGGGDFTRILAGPAVTTGCFSESASWADYDNDGDLDLFVANSGNVTATNFLSRNDGGGALTPISKGAIVTDVRTSRHGAWGDWDDDGDVDLYVAHENNEANQLYKNLLVETGTPDFESVAAGDATTDLASSFSASWGDYDNDGDLDLAVANFSNQRDALYVNQLVESGIPTFTKTTNGPSVTFGWTVGTVWGDFDNDADLDLVMTNGYSNTPGEVRRNFIFRNEAGTLVRDQTSVPAVDASWSYGASFGDMDADGDLDLFVANWLDNDAANFLYRNDAEANGNHWLQVRLVGTASNRSGIGARVRATATVGGSPSTQTREVAGSTGYCSVNLVQHFGLADATVVDLEIRWPSGTVQTLTGVPADQRLTVVETPAVGAPETRGLGSLVPTAHPNPFRDATTFRFALPHAARGGAPADLEIFDATGRRVRALALGTPRDPGPGGALETTSVAWDGRDSTGRRVPSGVYFYRVDSPEGIVAGKVSRLR